LKVLVELIDLSLRVAGMLALCALAIPEKNQTAQTVHALAVTLLT
jgi:hypothetical protein